MGQLLPFFLVLFTGVVFSALFNRLHVPWVVILILAGIVVGPHVLGVFELNETLIFMGEIGLVFLMFMAGLETRLSALKGSFKDIAWLALLNGLIPAFVGLGIALAFGYGWVAAFLLGIIFMSSSIAVVIPSLEASGLLRARLGKTIIASTIVVDVASLVLLSLLLQTIDPVARLPLPLFYGVLFAVLVSLRWALPKLRWLLAGSKNNADDMFQQELRTIFVILLGTVIIFETLGLHPIIAGFFAGLVLSDTIQSERVKEKLLAISYGVFIPVFFLLVGFETNISVFFQTGGAFAVVAVVTLGSLLAKFTSGWIAGKISGFSQNQSVLIGVATIPQLSTTLAVVFSAVELGLLQEELQTAMVVLSIVTTFAAPFLISFFAKKEPKIIADVATST